jgi:hypothetical protein
VLLKELVFGPIKKVITNGICLHRSGSHSEISIKKVGIITITDKLHEGKQEEEEEERHSCWCVLFVDGSRFEAKIVHERRGKFKIQYDQYGGKDGNKIVDALVVIRCKFEI